MKRMPWLLIAILILLLGIGLALYSRSRSNSSPFIRRWFSDPASRPGLITTRQQQPCPGAPFSLPSDGFIGLLWDDPAGPYDLFHTHSGIDIFGNGAAGEVPVYAAYDGELTRPDSWLATVIIRHEDPLQPGRIIWTYYTHMASADGRLSYVDAAFPPGTQNLPVKQGTLLGHQGEYSGTANPVGLHVHFSIVLSDPDGSFKNESWTANTLDPSPYLGMDLNSAGLPARPIDCHEG